MRIDMVAQRNNGIELALVCIYRAPDFFYFAFVKRHAFFICRIKITYKKAFGCSLPDSFYGYI